MPIFEFQPDAAVAHRTDEGMTTNCGIVIKMCDRNHNWPANVPCRGFHFETKAQTDHCESCAT